MSPFVFVSDLLSLRSADTFFVEVDPTLSDKVALLNWYANRLRFPAHFGANWDAFYDLLRDLELIEQHKVVLFHRELPLKNEPASLKVYLEVLADSVRERASDAPRDLVVTMAQSLRFTWKTFCAAIRLPERAPTR
jgi:barstar (barnase inhibitor)